MLAYTNIKPIPMAVKARLEKLMLMLGSANPGEAANAAGLITTLLADNGLDWHDVVGSMGRPSPDSFAATHRRRHRGPVPTPAPCPRTSCAR